MITISNNYDIYIIIFLSILLIENHSFNIDQFSYE